MTGNISLINVSWLWPVIFTALVLWIIFLWKDWSQAGSSRIFLKGSLAFLALSSLAMIALKPASTVPANQNKIAILTPGFEKANLDSLKKEHKKLKSFSYSKEFNPALELHKAEAVFILGEGIPTYDLWRFDSIPAVYIPGALPVGIINIKYNRESVVGDSLVIKGIYEKPVEGNSLILQGPGGIGLDSLVFTNTVNQGFSLSADLKSSGKYLFSLVEKNTGGGVVNREVIRVRVKPGQNLKIFILNSYPTFESKYLKNFLAETGNEVIARSRITTGRYKLEYFNTDRIPLGTLTDNNLKDVHLLIMDAREIRNLSNTEINILEDAVREQGMGLFVQPDGPYFSSPGKFSVFDVSPVTSPTIKLNSFQGISFNRQGFSLENSGNMVPVHLSQMEIISGYKPMGQGRIGTSVVENSWQLVLEGQNDIYRRLWTEIIEKLAKRHQPIITWESPGLPIYYDEPFNFGIKTYLQDPLLINNSGNIIPLRQDFDISEKWTGTTWPRNKGWQFMGIKGDSLHNLDFYVSGPGEWKALKAYNTGIANFRYFSGKNLQPAESLMYLDPLNPVWFFILFLICMGGLWLEPKLF
ncbi:hypothetical protein BH23BAC2_BH23BAC2_17880 [soil metagenome]